MADLKVLNDFFPVQFEQFDRNGNVVRRGETLIGNYTTSKGIRHRVRPRRRSVTLFEFHDDWLNAELVENIRPSGNTFWYSGPLASTRLILAYDRIDDSGSGSVELARALHKMAGSDFNFGETLVELDQSFRMIHNSLYRLYLYFSYAKKGNVEGIRKLIKSSDYKLRGVSPDKRLANAYLEYSFGWAPLIDSVYTAITQTHKIVTKKGALLSRRSGHRKSFTGVEASPRAGAFGYLQTPSVSKMNQLGITNPALMAWNRIPFSFLVDWVVPISSYLGALTWDAGLVGTGAWKISSSKSTFVVSSPELAGKTRRSIINETRYPANFSGTLNLTSPSFQASLSRIATIGALFSQLRR